jgi:hypothetical protein
MKRNRYPILTLLRVCLYVLAAAITSWGGIMAGQWNRGRIGTDTEFAMEMFVGMPLIFGCVGASAVLVFFAEMIKLVCDIQTNTWEAANEIIRFARGSKQQPTNPPDSQFQISVD